MTNFIKYNIRAMALAASILCLVSCLEKYP